MNQHRELLSDCRALFAWLRANKGHRSAEHNVLQMIARLDKALDTPHQPLGAFGELAPTDPAKVLEFIQYGRTVRERFTKDFPNLSREEIEREVGKAWAHRSTLEGVRLKSWSWPHAAIARIDTWLRRYESDRLDRDARAARASKAGVHVVEPAKRPDTNPEARRIYDAQVGQGIDMPPFEQWLPRYHEDIARKKRAPVYDDGPAPDLKALIRKVTST